MKIILSFGLIFFLTACQMSRKTNVYKLGSHITYVKDANTNLCFATINSRTLDGFSVTSFTCVPCDSLKNVKINILNKN